MTFLLAYWRIGLAALVLLVLGWVGFVVNGWHKDSLALSAAEARTEQIQREAAQTIATLKAAQEAAQKASQGLQDELQKLRHARKPAPVVRLCKPAPVPSPGEGRGGRDGAGPGTGELPATPGRDIGGDLYGLADDADEVAARLRACQALLK